MTRVKYQFNRESLSYEKVKVGFRERLLRYISWMATVLVFMALGVFIAYNTIDSPKEKALNREIETLRGEYDLLNKRLSDLSLVLNDLQERDNGIYRVIFEADPLPDEVRKAGFGGMNRYEKYRRLANGDIIENTAKKVDVLSKQLAVQSKSYDEILAMVKNKSLMLASIPAIQPIANKDLKLMASGFGYRTDPIYKTTKFHAGMDFAASTGTPIFATGDGVVARADYDDGGYGNHVRINHGYGYLTLYGHMSKIKAKVGQKVKRGDIIGFVGSTGKSVGPHLHYEVHKNNEPINPVNFYYNDLTPAEYAKMIELNNSQNQAFD
jgi:murein DD-endopeptidase MepM/ murein hydrolase activator NlpD